MKSALLLLFLISVSICHSQIDNTKTLDNSTWYFRSQGIPLTENASLTIGVYQYQFINLRILEVPLLLKLKITDDVSLLGGPTLDFYETPFGFQSSIDASTTLGIQYDLNPNTYIQGLYNYQLNNSTNSRSYKAGAPSSFSIRSGFKF